MVIVRSIGGRGAIGVGVGTTLGVGVGVGFTMTTCLGGVFGMLDVTTGTEGGGIEDADPATLFCGLYAVAKYIPDPIVMISATVAR
jgi:hypothetical protein